MRVSDEDRKLVACVLMHTHLKRQKIPTTFLQDPPRPSYEQDPILNS